MTAVTNYGSTFTFNGVTIGKCIIVGFPEVVMGEAETTNHSGSGYAESIPDGLVRVGDLTHKYLYETGVYTALRLLQTNKTVAAASLTNGIDTIAGSGWVRSVKIEDADATDPAANEIVVVLACTGAWT
jgi:hypothetical protein